MNGVTYITNDKGERLSAVVPIELFERLINNADGYPELYEQLHSSDAKAGDDTLYPHEVVSIMTRKDVSLMAAWRLYRNLTQTEVAKLIDVKQSTIAQIEKSDAPRKETLLKFAKLYGCTPEQLVLE